MNKKLRISYDFLIALAIYNFDFSPSVMQERNGVIGWLGKRPGRRAYHKEGLLYYNNLYSLATNLSGPYGDVLQYTQLVPTYLPFRPARAYINKQMYMRYCSQQLVVAVIQFLNVLGCSARGALKVGSFQLSNPTGRHLCFLPFMLLTPLPPQCMRFVPNDFLFYSPVILLSSL